MVAKEEAEESKRTESEARQQEMQREKQQLDERVKALVGDVARIKADNERLRAESTRSATAAVSSDGDKDAVRDRSSAPASDADSAEGERLASGASTPVHEREAEAHTRKARQERASLDEAYRHLQHRKQELKKQQRQIQAEKLEWRQKMSSLPRGANDRVAQQMRKSLDARSAEQNKAVREVQRLEAWLQQRERKIRDFTDAVRRLDESVAQTPQTWRNSAASVVEGAKQDSERGSSTMKQESPNSTVAWAAAAGAT